jgi:hypothetical protein
VYAVYSSGLVEAGQSGGYPRKPIRLGSHSESGAQ